MSARAPAETSEETIRRIATVPLSPFFSLQPVHWFLQTERIWGAVPLLGTAGREADQIQFENVVRLISNSNEDLQLILDLVSAPPVVNKYETLKRVFLERAGAREKAHLASVVRQPFLSVLENLRLERRAPTELLKYMAGLWPELGEELLLALWIRKLPVEAQCKLAATPRDMLLQDSEWRRSMLESLDQRVLEEYPRGYWEDSERLVRRMLDGYQAELAAGDLERCQISAPGNSY